MIRLLIIGFLFGAGAVVAGNMNGVPDRDKLWKEVEEAQQKGLPKTAIEKLQQIYDSAVEDEAFPEAIKAICQKYVIEGSVDQPQAPHVIRSLQKEIPDMPADIQPVMHAILADWYYSYYIQNQWRFYQRTQTSQPPSDDFETWDLPRLLDEIDKVLTAALEHADELKQIPIATYDDLLVKGNVTDAHRPTLYDFIAFHAVSFYAMDEQFVRQQDAFFMSADAPIFASIDEFLAWDPKTDDEDSFLLRAINIYQDIIRFHKEDDDKTALLDANLHRLVFGYTKASGSEKKARYKASLQRFADENSNHELSSKALAFLAGVQQADKEMLVALETASEGMERFPNSVGARQCYNLIQQIKATSFNVSTERVWNSAGPSIDVTYKNMEKIHFRLVKFNFLEWAWGGNNRPEYMPHEKKLALSKKKPVKEWSVDLPKTEDFLQRVESIPVDLDLESGSYFLIASYKPEFSQVKNQVMLTEVLVSELSVVMRSRHGEINVEGQVTEAISGKPVANANVLVNAWVHDGRNSGKATVGRVKTDESGLFRIKGRERSNHMIYVTKGDQNFGLIDQTYKYNNQSQYHPAQRTVFFTDRAIYRPGQTIHFKGVCVYGDTQKNQYRVIASKDISVILRDANGQEVEKKRFRTNEFGSFSGSFTAPRGRVTGQLQLIAENTPAGYASVQMEEYKRPKFYVEVDKPSDQFRLHETVKVEGKATGYTGAPIDGAKVQWRVVRGINYPQWWYWRCWYYPPYTNDEEIAHGVGKTDIDGTFAIEFEARPDPAVERESEPTFVYTVYADVTDTAGETRSSQQTVSIGYTSLRATLSCGSWLTTADPVKLQLSTTTLDGEGQESGGSLKIFRLKQPEKVHRAQLSGRSYLYQFYRNRVEAPADMSRIAAWPAGEQVDEAAVTTDGSGNKETEFELEAGAYKAEFETTDSHGQKVRAEVTFLVLDTESTQFTTRIPSHFEAESWRVEPGEEFTAVWGTGYESGQAYVEVEHRGKILNAFWTKPGETQAVIKQAVTEKLRGGFTVSVSYIRENRAYMETRRVDVPWTNKELTVKWEHFVSKLQPGGRETWTAVVSGPNAKKTAAEMVAALYDSSLDAFINHYWRSTFGLFYRDHSNRYFNFGNDQRHLQAYVYGLHRSYRDGTITYRYLPHMLTGYAWSYRENSGLGRGGGGGGVFGGGRTRGLAVQESAAQANYFADDMALPSAANSPMDAARKSVAGEAGSGPGAPGPDLSQVQARKKLQETAFFFPHLLVDADGNVRIEFEIPEALTKWKFMGFAHDADLRTALLTDEVVTSKDLMVQPNPPRFLREGDVLEFSVKVSNQSATRQNGSVRLTFADAQTEKNMDGELQNMQLDQSFEIPAGQSKSLYWRLNVPDFTGILTYKAVAATDKLSDGEEGYLPILSRRILVTESIPLPIRKAGTKEFDFERLKMAGESDTLQSQTLTVQMTSNPAWYAVMALPYLMEYPHSCSEQVFNRLYANSLARHIANSDPKIRRIFDQWRDTDALDSPLEKNDELRNIVIAESPWLLDGKKESEARRNVGILFDDNRLNQETASAMLRLSQMQYSDGAWPWFPGGPANDYLTLYITTGFGRLRHLGVDVDVAPAVKAADRLDYWLDTVYQKIMERPQDKDLNHLSPRICLYLYGRSFFLDDHPVDEKFMPAVNYFLGQGKRYWVELQNRQSQGHLAIGLKRFGDLDTPKDIMASLKERSLSDEEMGMFWREGQMSWWWYKAPIETQALMIEAFDEVMDDQESVEECKVWLLKQKQTQNWKTTKATADAVYGLLLRGTDILSSSELVTVKLGEMEIEPEQIEAGTGFYEQKFVRNEIVPEMGQISLTKKDDGVAWGSVHWQYLEDMSKIEPYEGTPLKIKKSLYLKKNTEEGPTLIPIDGPVEVGDELVTRVELRVDREMEYVHLKDYRGSGTEPVDVISKYQYQDGLAYYQSTRDTASHFFIDYLPRGTYVFEYSVRIQHRGTYQTGIAEFQCMYAPEFNSHSGSVEIEVQ